MQIDRKLVLHVAKLANLELSDADAARYETQLGRILEYVKLLDGVGGEAAKPWREPEAASVERQDAVVPPLDPEAALAMAPERHDTAFQVPKIIE
jgi:aspartyl-tRNA(Asn)/glutamyl-tRNA(Gln) amidotransferase subunit C